MNHRFREQFAPISDHDQGERYPDESEEDAEDPSPVGRWHDVAVSYRVQVNQFHLDETGTISYQSLQNRSIRASNVKLISCFLERSKKLICTTL